MRHSATSFVRAQGVVLLLGFALFMPSEIGRAQEVASDSSAGSRLIGRGLSEVLLELQAAGLDLVFSDLVVIAEMTVAEQPSATEPRLVLEELLREHGLVAREGAGGTLVVVRAAPVGELTYVVAGSVRSRRGFRPVAGVSVTFIGSAAEVVTAADGRFEFPGVEPGTHRLRVRHPEFVVEELEVVAASSLQPAEIVLTLQPAPLTHDEIVVSPSQISLQRELPAAPLSLSREDIENLPHLGDDIFRAFSLLPGVSSNDVTAQFHIRGGRRDEVQILLDGQELYEAFHLKDYDSASSIVAPAGLGSVDLSTGGSPANYGDRMGGVLYMTTKAPAARRSWVGVSVLNAQVGSSGLFADDRGAWLGSFRRGSLDLAGKLLGRDHPSFWDLFGKLDYRFEGRQALRLNILRAADQLDLSEVEGEESKNFATDYDNSYVWMTHQAVLRDDLFVDTALSRSSLDRDRRGLELEEEQDIEVRDLRELEVSGLLQGWHFQAGARNLLEFGFEARRFEALYDYTKSLDRGIVLVPQTGTSVTGPTRFLGSFDDDYLGVYFSDQLHPTEPLSMVLGLRYDEHSLTGDSLLSPRINVGWSVGESGILRFSWGHFHQSQRAYELQVEDGEDQFHTAEKTVEWIAGFERYFGRGGKRPVVFRAEVYRRRISDPKPRYENLFEPLNTFPEAEPDRLLVAPLSSSSEGFELFLRGKASRRLDWWLTYGVAEIEDELATVEAPRLVDQERTVNVDFNYRLGEHWNVNLAWRFHTGRPTTAVLGVVELGEPGDPEESGEPEDGEAEEDEPALLGILLGPLNGLRLPSYHRLDLRASRKWRLASGELTFYVDVQNLYDRRNIAGFDREIDEEELEILTMEEHWPGIFPSIGLTYEF